MAEADLIDVNPEFAIEPRVADHVVDADVHVTPPPTVWKDYLSPRYRELAPRTESEDEFDYIVFEGARRAVDLMQSQAGRDFRQYNNAGKLSDMRTGGWMAPQRLRDMDRDGIDKAAVFGGGPLSTGNPDHMDSFQAFNRWQSDFCADGDGRLFAVAFLTTVDVETTVKGMREAKARGDAASTCPRSRSR